MPLLGRSFLPYGFVMALVLRASAGFAHEPEEAPPGEGHAPEVGQGEGVTVTVEGTKKAGSASETTVEKDVISAAPRKNASELLKAVPGVFVTQHSGEGKASQIFLRGFDAQHGQDVEIWAGGAPVNEVSNLHGQGYADLHFVIPEVIQRVRSLPGTYDVSQGDFAVAGSLAFDLGYDEPGFTLSTSIGSFFQRRLFMAYHPPTFGSETFAAVEAEASNGFGPNRASRNVSALGQVGFDVSDTVHVRLMASFYAARFDSAGVLPLDLVSSGEIGLFDTLDPNQGGDSMRVQFVGEVRQYAPDARDKFRIAPFFVARDLKLRQNYTGFLIDDVNGDGTQQTNHAKTAGITGSYSRRFDWLSPRDEVELGVFARSDWIDQAQVRLAGVDDTVTAELVNAEIRATNVAGWVQAELTAARRVRMRAGLRADGLFYSSLDNVREGSGAERSAMGFHLGPKATVDVLLVPGWNALASFGMGFRSPQARSLGDGETTPFTEVISFEGGTRYSLGPELAIKAAAFHTRLNHDLVFDEAVARNEPVGGTARTGAVLEVSSRPVPWFVMASSFTYTHAAFTEDGVDYSKGDLLPYAPQIVARADIGAQPRLATLLDRALVLKAGAGLSYAGLRPLPYSETGHDIFLVDASLGLRWKEIEAKVDVFNLFDTRWYDGEFTYASNFDRGAAASLVPQRHVTVGYPITVLGTISGYL